MFAGLSPGGATPDDERVAETQYGRWQEEGLARSGKVFSGSLQIVDGSAQVLRPRNHVIAPGTTGVRIVRFEIVPPLEGPFVNREHDSSSALDQEI